MIDKSKRYKGLVLCLIVICSMLATGCPKPKKTTVNGQCTRNANGTLTCGGGVSIEWDAPTIEDPEDSKLIVDVPGGWSSDFTGATVDVVTNYEGSGSGNFNVALSPTTTTLDPIETGATVHTFLGDETTILAAASSQSSGSDAKLSYQYSVTQNSCDLPSGEYTFHIRGQGPGRLVYLGSVTINYEVETQGSCEGSTASVKQ